MKTYLLTFVAFLPGLVFILWLKFSVALYYFMEVVKALRGLG